MITPKTYKNILSVVEKAQDASGQLHSLAGAISVSSIFDNSVYKPEYFKTYELVDPVTFASFGENSLWFMDSRILWTGDALREYFNAPCIVNNYMTAKTGEYIYKDSGLRYEINPGAARSQHLYGRALDIKISGISSDDARKEILSKQGSEPAFRFITAVELGVSWLHVDCRNTNKSDIFTFSQGG